MSADVNYTSVMQLCSQLPDDSLCVSLCIIFALQFNKFVRYLDSAAARMFQDTDESGSAAQVHPAFVALIMIKNNWSIPRVVFEMLCSKMSSPTGPGHELVQELAHKIELSGPGRQLPGWDDTTAYSMLNKLKIRYSSAQESAFDAVSDVLGRTVAVNHFVYAIRTSNKITALQIGLLLESKGVSLYTETVCRNVLLCESLTLSVERPDPLYTRVLNLVDPIQVFSSVEGTELPAEVTIRLITRMPALDPRPWINSAAPTRMLDCVSSMSPPPAIIDVTDSLCSVAVSTHLLLCRDKMTRTDLELIFLWMYWPGVSSDHHLSILLNGRESSLVSELSMHKPPQTFRQKVEALITDAEGCLSRSHVQSMWVSSVVSKHVPERYLDGVEVSATESCLGSAAVVKIMRLATEDKNWSMVRYVLEQLREMRMRMGLRIADPLGWLIMALGLPLLHELRSLTASASRVTRDMSLPAVTVSCVTIEDYAWCADHWRRTLMAMDHDLASSMLHAVFVYTTSRYIEIIRDQYPLTGGGMDFLDDETMCHYSEIGTVVNEPDMSVLRGLRNCVLKSDGIVTVTRNERLRLEQAAFPFPHNQWKIVYRAASPEDLLIDSMWPITKPISCSISESVIVDHFVPSRTGCLMEILVAPGVPVVHVYLVRHALNEVVIIPLADRDLCLVPVQLGANQRMYVVCDAREEQQWKRRFVPNPQPPAFEILIRTSVDDPANAAAVVLWSEDDGDTVVCTDIARSRATRRPTMHDAEIVHQDALNRRFSTTHYQDCCWLDLNYADLKYGYPLFTAPQPPGSGCIAVSSCQANGYSTAFAPVPIGTPSVWLKQFPYVLVTEEHPDAGDRVSEIKRIEALIMFALYVNDVRLRYGPITSPTIKIMPEMSVHMPIIVGTNEQVTLPYTRFRALPRESSGVVHSQRVSMEEVVRSVRGTVMEQCVTDIDTSTDLEQIIIWVSELNLVQ